MNSRIAHPFITLLAIAGIAAAQDATSIDLEGSLLLNLDLGGILMDELGSDNVPFSLTDAEFALGAVDPASGVGLQTVVLHDAGAIVLDQAYGTWKSPAADLRFGLAPVEHGIFSARLIHDPLLQQDVESILPAICLSHAHGPAVAHLALAAKTTTTVDDSTGALSESSAPQLFPAIDFQWGREGLVRASGLVPSDRKDVDLAAVVPVGPVVLDLEGVLADGEAAPAELAYLVGAAWNPTTPIGLATRFDARKSASGDWERLLAAGVSCKIGAGFSIAAEWIEDLEGADHIATLRLGTELAWSRPGARGANP